CLRPGQALFDVAAGVFVIDEDVHDFMLREQFHHPHEDRAHLRHAVGPGDGVFRPGQPGSGVAMPFRWHPISKGGWRGHERVAAPARERGESGPLASVRRSRRKGQFWRVSSMRFRSHSTIRVSSLSSLALAMMRPKGSATNDCPQNCSWPSLPTRFTAPTKTPLAIAWARWMVS